jgi:alkylation response protein AidB-like acyl-CoA dehydrogenase
LLIVVIHEDDGSYAVAAVGAERLQTERRDGLDPSLMATFVSGASDDFQVLAVGGDAEQWWNETVAIARVAICYSLVASMHRMVQLASEHAASRHQFGRPIGTFQAVRHRLAESLVATDAAEAVVSEVWRSDNFELAAAVAKLVTSNAVKVVTSHTQQVLAGIGFTAEHEFHRYMKRAVVLDRLFLNSTDLATAIGRELMQQKYAPRLFEL